MAEFRYYLQVLDQDEVTAIQDELLDKYNPTGSCDASTPPDNGGVGNCTDNLGSRGSNIFTLKAPNVGSAIRKFHGAAAASNGKIIFAPFNADGVGVFDPSDNSFELEDISAIISSDFKFAGAVAASNGKIIFAPLCADGVGVFDPSAPPGQRFALEDISSYISIDWKFRFAVAASNGKIIFAPDMANGVGVFDPDDNSFALEAISDISAISASSGRKFFGAAAASNGKVIFAPFNANGVGVFDPSDNSFELVDISDTISSVDKFFGAVAASNGKIIFVPRNANGVGVFDPSDNSFALVDISATISSSEKFFGAVAASNGKIIFAPWHANGVGVFDPSDNSFALEDISATISSSEKFTDAVAASNGKIIFVPYNAAGVGVFEMLPGIPTSCVPTCNPGYVLEGVTSCIDRVLTEAVCTPSSYIGTTSGHRYWVPNGGPGLGGKVFDVDPTSPGNGPPVTGTFYPSERLTCMFTCPLTVTNASWPSNSSNATNPNSTSGSYVDLSAYHASLRRAEEGFDVDASSFTGGNVNVSSFALTRGVASDAATVSARTRARWIDYTHIACASPPRPTPSFSTRTLGDGSVVAVDASRSCVVTVSNDGDVFDDYYANGGPIGGSRDANAPVMPNAAAVPFRYVGDAPTVTSISSRHGVRPEALARLGLPAARGPFAGGTTVTVRGDGFLPGDNLRCRFADDVTGLPPFVADATWVDDRSVTCLTPPRAPRETTRRAPGAMFLYPGDGTDPRASLEVGYDANTMNGTIAPCFVANVAVSNDGVAFSDDAPGAKFLYCDVYAAAASSVADPTYPYVTDPSTLAGTPNAPFTDLQSALHAALRGARVDVADGRTDGGVVTVRRSQGPVPRSARWLDKDVVRLAPGVYRGEGNVLLALDAQLVDFVAGDVDDWPDVERGGNGRVGPTASVDCREVSLGRGNKLARGSLRLFASQRVQVGGTPSVVPDGTGAIAGDGAVAFRGVSLEGCFDDAGAGESFADGGASCPAIEGRVAGGCRGDAHYVAPELPGHASGGYATDPDVWETWEYEDEDARYSNEAAWYDYEA